MLKFTLFSLCLLMLTACGQKGAVTETKFVISGLAATPIDFTSSSALVTAYNPNTQLIMRLQLSSNSQSVTLPNGTWYFSVVQWNSLNTEAAAQVRCGITKEELTGESLSLNITLTIAACLTPDFNAPQFTNAGNFQALKLNQCSTFGLPSADCFSTPGFIRGVRIAFHNIQLSPVDTPAVAPNTIVSPCIAIGAGTGIIDLFTKLPSGSNVAPVPFTIRAFSDTGCGTQTRFFRFHRGLMSGDEGDMRVYDDIATNTTRVMIRDGGITPLHALLVLPAETSYKFNLNNFFTGGTPPYTFSETGSCGAVSGSMYTPDGATGSGCIIEATDANLNSASFAFSTVQSGSHTIFSTPAVGNWSILSRSTRNLTLNSPGDFDLRDPDVHRFSSFASPAAPLVATDRYLLLEKSSSNRIIDITNLASASWGRTSGIPSAPTSNTTFGAEIPFFELNKSVGVSGSISQALPSFVGNHVASVYLKRGTSRFAALKLVTPSSTMPCRGIIVDLDTGANAEMSSCPYMTTGPGLYGAQHVGDGWWRVWITGNFAGAAGQQFVLYPAWNAGAAISFTEVPVATGTVSVLLPQIEGGDRPTSAMHLSNTARGSEYISNINTSIVNADLTTGTFLLDWHAREPEPNKRLLSFCNINQTVMAIEVTGSGLIGRPRVAFPTLSTSLETTTAQDITLESQNRIAFKIGSGQLKIFKRSDATPVSAAIAGYSGPRDHVRMGSNCDNTAPQNMGVRRFGYWAVPFEDIVLKEMSNDSN